MLSGNRFAPFEIMLAMVASLGFACDAARADNTTFATRAYSALGSGNLSVSGPANSSASRYWTYNLTAGRSYIAFGYLFWGPDARGGNCDVSWLDNTGTPLGAPGGDQEPNDFGSDGDSLVVPNSPAGSFEYTVQLFAAGSVAQSATCVLRVVETTLFSPWFFRDAGAGYDGFAEIKNTTTSAVTVIVNAYRPNGTISGSSSVAIPPNGVTLVTASSLGAAASGFGSMSIAHTGKIGAITANMTSLSATTGLSFDAPFTTRQLIPLI